VAEAEQLAAQGVQEIILISQITNYGLDLYGEPRLTQLLRALGRWTFRGFGCTTPIPLDSPQELEAIQETPNVLPYLDLPLQHSHPEILRAMNRPWRDR